MEPRKSKIRKEGDSIILLNERYRTPHTSLLLFHFEPETDPSLLIRLQKSVIEPISVEGKDLFLFDQFFSKTESDELRVYSRRAPFSRVSFASQESREKGETPARSMNNKEKWEFFSNPPQAVSEIYKLLSSFSHLLDADISTLPWDLCDEKICASAVATNRIEHVPKASMEMGKHEDVNPEEGIPFGIPILYEKEHSYFPNRFINGALGYPWLTTLMIYASEENFLAPDYGMGTVFYHSDGKIAAKAAAKHARFVLFEGDILHSIEESHIPPTVNTWRISYVFKLMINPRKGNMSMKSVFNELIKNYQNK